MKIADIKTIVSLTLARLDIVKLKHADGGYLWSTVNEEGKKQIESALVDIDKLLLSLSKPDSPSPDNTARTAEEILRTTPYSFKERGHFEATLQAMEEYANQFKSHPQQDSKEVEEIYEIDFGNHLRAKVKIVGNKIQVEGAINGWGNVVPLNEIKITNNEDTTSI